MWLIETSKLQLHEFVREQAPDYGVLSHRWDAVEDEMTFKDFLKKRRMDSKGYEKIARFCDLLRSRGIQWAWVDTCCIDKKSSAELSEAINSMYSFYEKSVLCCVYLRDASVECDNWKSSEWWRRGWTLQELLAPSEVLFLDQHWRAISSKRESATAISTISNIPCLLLLGINCIEDFCVAQRMSWAAGRQTARIEDRAYSLMGIFDIHMPLLYGEGLRAFQRLQLEILRKHPDESIFAWRSDWGHVTGVLATHPDQFRLCSDLEIDRWDSLDRSGIPDCSPPRITSWGIEMQVGAQALVPRRPLTVQGAPQRRLWCCHLTTSRDGGLDLLPCTVLFVRCGPTPYSYMRYGAIHDSNERAMLQLRHHFDIVDIEHNKLMYLHFDAGIK